MSYLDHDLGYELGYDSDSRPTRNNSATTQFSPDAPVVSYQMDRFQIDPSQAGICTNSGGGVVTGMDGETYCEVPDATPSVLETPGAPPEPTAEEPAADPAAAAEELAEVIAARPPTAPHIDPSAPTTSPAEEHARSVLSGAGVNPDDFFAVVHPASSASERTRTAFFNRIAGMSGDGLEREYAETNARQLLDHLHSEGSSLPDALRLLEAEGAIDDWSDDMHPAEWPRRTSEIPLGFSGVSTDEVRDSHRALSSIDLGDDPTRTIGERTARRELENHWVTGMTSGDHPWTEAQARGVLDNLHTDHYDVDRLGHILFDLPEGTTVDPDHIPEASAARVPTYDGAPVDPAHSREFDDSPEPLARAALEYGNAHAPVSASTVIPEAPTASTDPATTGTPADVPPGYGDAYHRALASYTASHPATPGVDTSTHEPAPPPPVAPEPRSEAVTTALTAEAGRMRAIGFSDDEIQTFQDLHPNRPEAEITSAFTQDGGDIPEADQADELARGREALERDMISEGATAIRRRDPSISTANAELMAGLSYREHEASTPEAMSGVRSSLIADLGHEDLDGLYGRTVTHELAELDTTARAAVPAALSGRGGFYAATDAGSHNVRLFVAHAGGEDASHDPSAIHRLAHDEHLAARLEEFSTGAGRSGSSSRTALESELGSSGASLESRIRGISGLRGPALRSALANAATTVFTAEVEDRRRAQDHEWHEEDETFTHEERLGGEAHAFAMAVVQQRMQMEANAQNAGLGMFGDMFRTPFDAMTRSGFDGLNQQREALFHEVQAGEQLQSVILASMYPPQRMA